jgi:hypothetical protein
MKIRRHSNIRGVALLTALFFGILCMGLAVGFILQIPVDLGATKNLERDTKAFYVADAGVQDSLAWMSRELAEAREPCTMSDPIPQRNGALGDWTWTCQIEPDEGTPPNGLDGMRIYKLTSVASHDEKEQYRIITQVQGGQSFSRFSLYTDLGDDSQFDFAVTSHLRIRGPVHKNRAIRFFTGSNFLSGNKPSERPFDSLVTTSAPANEWGGAGEPPANQLDFVFENGAADIQYGTPERPLPDDSSLLANAAWGTPVPSTPPPGVTLNPLGGVYIQGDVDSMEMKVNSNDHFVLEIVQAGELTTVIEDSDNDVRIVTGPDGLSQSVPGLGSGVIYSTGDIKSLKGINKGPHTVATKFEDGKNIEISGSLTRHDTPLGNPLPLGDTPVPEPTGTADRLGLVSNYLNIAKESVLPRNVNNPLFVYASILAAERLQVHDETTGSPGAMVIYGGLASGRTLREAVVDDTGRTLTGYGGRTGWGTPEIHYDKLLANDPPPDYPSTAGAELTIRSWVEQSL